MVRIRAFQACDREFNSPYPYQLRLVRLVVRMGDSQSFDRGPTPLQAKFFEIRTRSSVGLECQITNLEAVGSNPTGCAIK